MPVDVAAVAELPVQDPGERLSALVDGAEVPFRLPTTADLIALRGYPRDRARVALLAACLGAEPGTTPGPEAEAAVEMAMEQAAPAGAIDLLARCPACGLESSLPLDVPALLWAEIEAQASALLRDVHALATSYGWTEADVLDLSPRRRAMYLELAGDARVPGPYAGPRVRGRPGPAAPAAVTVRAGLAGPADLAAWPESPDPTLAMPPEPAPVDGPAWLPPRPGLAAVPGSAPEPRTGDGQAPAPEVRLAVASPEPSGYAQTTDPFGIKKPDTERTSGDQPPTDPTPRPSPPRGGPVPDRPPGPASADPVDPATAVTAARSRASRQRGAGLPGGSALRTANRHRFPPVRRRLPIRR